METQPQLLHFFATFAFDLMRLCAWLLLLLVIFVPIEKRWSQRTQKLLRRAFGVDLVYYFLSGFTPKLLLILPLTLIAAVTHHFVGGGFYSSVASMPLWLRFTTAIFVGEVGGYWGHRWSHEIPLLWRFHSIHHSAEEIDWLVNSRMHPFDMVFTRLCGLVPMYLLGLAQPTGNSLDFVPIWFTLVGTLWGFFIHANVNWRFGWLEWLVSTPAFHHWHHTNDSPESINKNYSALLPWVDKCFGTWYMPKKQWPTKYGIDDPVPPGLAGQLLHPFLPWDRDNVAAAGETACATTPNR